MTLRATIIFALLLGLTLPVLAQQEVTVRDINKIPDANINELMQLGADLTDDDVDRLVKSEYAGDIVSFVGVVLSDPLYSGLASASPQPGRIHIFVRDTSAATLGKEGMDIQVVDGSYDANGTIDLTVGDVARFTVLVNYFGGGNTVQLEPESPVEYFGPYDALGLPDDILDPVIVSTADIARNVGESEAGPAIQANWEKFSEMNNQYVRLEGATVWRSPNRLDDRPNYAITTDGAETVVVSDDMSLRYRNDKAAYPDPFLPLDPANRFEAPPAGATVDIQGFVLIRSYFNPPGMEVGSPPGALMRIAPWTDDDLVVTAEPLITNLDVRLLDRVVGNEDVTIEATFEGDPTNVGELVLTYDAGSGEQEVTMTQHSDTSFVGTIPAQADEAFVSYFATLTDVSGTEYVSASQPSYRVLYDGISQIRHIRETQTGRRARSPFYGMTVPMDITARVQSDVSESELITIQDDEELGLWSGVWVRPTEALLADLSKGDEIRITEGTVEDDFGVVFLRIEDYEVVARDAGIYPHKLITTDLLQDQEIAEPHVGMLLRFEDVVITDPDAGFGEWFFSTEADGSDDVGADDYSGAIAEGFASSTFTEGGGVTYLQGAWYFSFSVYKLVPMVPTDIGELTGTSSDLELASEFALEQNYPNPFNPSTKIEYSVPAASQVALEVYDMLGRRVKTLVDGLVPAGKHAVVFEANDLASGLYLYRLRAGENVTTRTMMLVK